MDLLKPFKDLIEKIGEATVILWHAAQKVFEKLDPAVKEALKIGAGITAFINENLDKDPEVVLAITKQAFPNVTEEQIRDIMKKSTATIETIDTVEGDTLLETIFGTQKWLGSKTGSNWAFASDTLAKAIALAAAPPGTKFAIIASLITSTYYQFFKKDAQIGS